MASTAENQVKLKEKPLLQLTTVAARKGRRALEPLLTRIPSMTIPNQAPGLPDLVKIHEALLGIKQKFPAETKIVLVPTKGTNYDTLITLMDGMRGIEKTDPPLFAKNLATGIDEPVKALFPEVIFGNLLGDG